MQIRESWLLFALGSALFAALTALFGKLGVVGINANLATFIRTVVILIVTAGILSLRQEWAKRPAIAQLVDSGALGHCHRFVLVVLLPGPATGADQQGRTGRQAQRGTGYRAWPGVSR
jgi:hypothetical protein